MTTAREAKAYTHADTLNSLPTHTPISPLASLRATRAVLDEFGLSTKKSLGQNFLVNDDIIRKIIELAQPEHNDHVLEVGPGIGTLTVPLLARVAHVTSVERDNRLPRVLAKTTRNYAHKFTLIQKDALDLRVEDFECAKSGVHEKTNEKKANVKAEASAQKSASSGAVLQANTNASPYSNTYPPLPTKFIANLPYAVAATLILDYFQKFPSIKSATVMVQREVADRITAKPNNKNYGAYTVKLGMYAQVTGKFLVSPGNFFPPPHVDSTVIRLDRATPRNSEGHELSSTEKQLTCIMADAAFASRRKTIANSFKAYFSNSEHVTKIANLSSGASAKNTITSAQLADIFNSANIEPSRRGETLTQQEFIQLAQKFDQVLLS